MDYDDEWENNDDKWEAISLLNSAECSLVEAATIVAKEATRIEDKKLARLANNMLDRSDWCRKIARQLGDE